MNQRISGRGLQAGETRTAGSGGAIIKILLQKFNNDAQRVRAVKLHQQILGDNKSAWPERAEALDCTSRSRAFGSPRGA